MKLSQWIAVLLVCGLIGLTRAGEPATQPSTQPAAIAASDAAALKAAVGQTVSVEGVIESAQWSSTGKVMNIYFKDADQGLIGTIFERNKNKMDGAFNNDTSATLTGAKVRITGKLSDYGGKVESMKGRQQIVIMNPEQIVILEAAKKD